MRRINALLLCIIGCTAFAPPTPLLRRQTTAVAAKKKVKPAGGGFGAAPEKGPSEKPFKSQVVNAQKKFAKWRNDEVADVWIASRDQPTRWWKVGYAACKSGGDVAGATNAQKALIFKMGVTLAARLAQAPDGLIAATAPYQSDESVVDMSVHLTLVPRDAVAPPEDEYGYEPKVYESTDNLVTVEREAS
jgi:hypothetical protein